MFHIHPVAVYILCCVLMDDSGEAECRIIVLGALEHNCTVSHERVLKEWFGTVRNPSHLQGPRKANRKTG